MSTLIADAPVLDLDLFCDDSLRDPFGNYKAIRDAGPAVWLPRYSVYAIGRFYDVQAALRANDRLINGEGIGFSDVWNSGAGSNILQMDGKQHSRLRNIVMKPLTPAALRSSKEGLRQLISKRIDALTGAGTFNAMQDLCACLPIEAISYLVGLPDAGRERQLDWAASTFNLIGPNPRESDIAVSAEARKFMDGLSPSNVRSGSWAADLFAAVDGGRLTQVEAMQAISAYVIPSLDTTILSKGHLLYNLASNPEQWNKLRQNPEKVSAAVTESVRRNSIVRWFARVATEDYDADGVVIPKGARVMILYGSANRDERRYPDPDSFDIDRDARDQLAWGTGAHMCAGMHLARLEMEILLEALIEANVELVTGAPTIGLNRGLTGFAELPYQLNRAGS